MYYKLSLWRVRVTIAAVERQKCVLCVFFKYVLLSTTYSYHTYKVYGDLCLRQQQQNILTASCKSLISFLF